jgi:hypothetical protein
MQFSFYELKQAYFELITTIVPGPASWSYFVPLFLLPLGLLVPSSTLSHGQLCSIILPTSLAATIHAWLVLGGNDVISTDSLYMTLFLYYFKDPRQDFRRVIRFESDGGSRSLNTIEPDQSKQRGDATVPVSDILLESYPESFSNRLAWAVMLPQSRPLHDWIIGNTGHDRRVLTLFRHPTRTQFMVGSLLRLLPVLLIFLPLSKQLARDDPYFSDPSWSMFDAYAFDDSNQTATAALIRSFVPAIILRPMTMAMYAYSLLLCLFLPPMLLFVLLNALRLVPDKWSPHTWRPHFGPFSAIQNYGIRGFWGQWWHQQMRHIVSEPGRWLAAKLTLQDSGWQKTLRYMWICVSAFALSGVTHSGMVPPNPRFATIDAKELRFRLASFFWVQPIGIAVELLILEPILRTTPYSWRSLQRLLRVFWTVGWMCFSCHFLVVPFGQLGYWSIVPSYSLPYFP